MEHWVVVRGEEGTLFIYCIIYQLYIYYSAVHTDHVWSCLAATRRLSITWSTGHGAHVSGRLLRYPVTTVHLSRSLKALPNYWRRCWHLGLSHLLSLVLAGASRPFNKTHSAPGFQTHSICHSATDNQRNLTPVAAPQQRSVLLMGVHNRRTVP